MKKVPLKKVKMEVRDKIGDMESIDLDYNEQIMSLILIPFNPEGGTNYEEMAIVYPIYNKFKKRNKDTPYIVLEDAEHKEVVKRLKNCKFRQNTPEIFEMIKEVDEAPEYEMKVVPEDEASG